jgi:hypothetical protein
MRDVSFCFGITEIERALQRFASAKGNPGDDPFVPTSGGPLAGTVVRQGPFVNLIE